MDRKLRILIDLDDVLCHSVDRVIELYNKEYQTNHVLEDFHGWTLSDYATSDIYKYYGKEGLHFFRDLAPMDDMIALVKELLSEGHEVVIATSIRKENIEGTLDKALWVEEHLPNISDLKIVQSKSDIAGDILIDDGTHNLDVSPATHKVLFDRPWNRDNSTYIRVFDANDVRDYISNL